MRLDSTKTAQDLQRWHNGDVEGLNALLKRHLPWVQKHISERIGDQLRKKMESCDVIQDAILEFLRYAPKFIISDARQFRALLLKITENVLRDKYDWFMTQRRAIVHERPLPSDTILNLDPAIKTDKTPSQSAERHEEEAWLRLGIELLDMEDRDILVLRQWKHLSFIEIGDLLHISENAAWKRHKQAVAKLAQKVGKLRHGELWPDAERNLR